MAMHNVTLTCPECKEPQKAVGNQDESTGGNEGKFFCFSCGAKGDFEVRYFNIEVNEETGT